jgi:hypothetical protein
MTIEKERLMFISRRSLIAGVAGLVTAPAIVRASSLMPVRALPVEAEPWAIFTPGFRMVAVKVDGVWRRCAAPALYLEGVDGGAYMRVVGEVSCSGPLSGILTVTPSEGATIAAHLRS